LFLGRVGVKKGGKRLNKIKKKKKEKGAGDAAAKGEKGGKNVVFEGNKRKRGGVSGKTKATREGGGPVKGHNLGKNLSSRKFTYRGAQRKGGR